MSAGSRIGKTCESAILLELCDSIIDNPLADNRFVPQTLSELHFELPAELIANEPLIERSASRLMIVNRGTTSFEDKQFSDVADFLTPGDVLVVNNTKVFPARLYGHTESGATIEIFLIEQLYGVTWRCLAKPGRRLKTGKRIDFDDSFSCEVLGKEDNGIINVKFNANSDLDVEIDRLGVTPLPPYIQRDHEMIGSDRERYQTVYASERGAIAAPTAGLHFTPEVLRAVRAIGVEIVEITLHVGYGTFEPVRTEILADHRVAKERYSISDPAAAVINRALSEGRRVIAVGTTTTRALESSFANNGLLTAGTATADLTILPGFQFKVVKALLTNFHLPKSSLLILVSTFAGHELIMDAYKHAIAESYRFYSYGDCMLIV
jgi:S-adenosylmethionine:tRNA ribosyltransferase-isomerase